MSQNKKEGKLKKSLRVNYKLSEGGYAAGDELMTNSLNESKI